MDEEKFKILASDTSLAELKDDILSFCSIWLSAIKLTVMCGVAGCVSESGAHVLAFFESRADTLWNVT